MNKALLVLGFIKFGFIVLPLSLSAFSAVLGYRKIALNLLLSVGVSWASSLILVIIVGLFPIRLGDMVVTQVAAAFAGLIAYPFLFIVLLLILMLVSIKRSTAFLRQEFSIFPRSVFFMVGLVPLFFLGKHVQAYFYSMPAHKSNIWLCKEFISLRAWEFEGADADLAELRKRGKQTVPDIISALHSVPESEIRQPFGVGRPQEKNWNYGVVDLLHLLGQFGGSDALTELRSWLGKDVAPEIRTAAAVGLSSMHDHESAHSIALLLRNRDFDWRLMYPDLISALCNLQAVDEFPYIKETVIAELNGGEDQMMDSLKRVAPTLRHLHTPEAEDLANRLSSWKYIDKRQVRRTVK